MKKISTNYIYNTIYQLITLIVPIILIPYLARTLTDIGSGQYSYARSYLLYFSSFALFGSVMYGSRTISKRRDIQYLSENFWGIVILKFITSTISILIYLAFTFIFFEEFKVLFLINGIFLFANMIDITWFFMGQSEFKIIMIRNLILKSLMIIAIFLLVHDISDVPIYAAIVVISEFISHVWMWLNVRKRIKFVKIGFNHVIKHFIDAKYFFMFTFVTQLYTTINITLIGVYTNNSQVAFFDQSAKIVNVVLVVITSLGTVMMPKISSLYGEGKIQEIYRLLNKSINLMVFIAIPAVSGIILVADIFIPWFMSDIFNPMIIVLIIYSLKIPLAIYSNLIGTQFIIPSGDERFYLNVVIIGAAINIILNLIGLQFYGAAFSAIVTLVTEVIILVLFIHRIKTIFRYIIKNPSDQVKTFVISLSLFLVFKLGLLEILRRLTSNINSEFYSTGLLLLMVISLFIGLYLLINYIFRNNTLLFILDFVKSTFLKIKRRNSND